jgi:hypothetical protein
MTNLFQTNDMGSVGHLHQAERSAFIALHLSAYAPSRR